MNIKIYFYTRTARNNVIRRGLHIFGKSDFVNKVLDLAKKEMHG